MHGDMVKDDLMLRLKKEMPTFIEKANEAYKSSRLRNIPGVRD